MPAPSPASGGEAGSTLIVNEIFFSIQGESSRAGLPTTFIRLTGCPLRCRYCDTAYAFHEGAKKTLPEILEAVRARPSRYVTVTGGEPLAQKNCRRLLRLLCDAAYRVSLETGGAMDIAGIDRRVSRIVDLKTPGSGEQARNRYENLAHLGPTDEVKFVLCDRADYDWAKKTLTDFGIDRLCTVLFSASHGQLAEAELAQWILEDGLPVRFQTQLHKKIWGDEAGR